MIFDKQTIGHEHLVTSNGALLGLHTVNVKAAQDQYEYWEGVEEIIKAYTRIRPGEMAAIIADNRLQQTQNFHATGRNASGSQRQTIGLPFSLTLLLDEYDPDLLTDKRKLHTFMRLFPGLRTCQTV
jgi:hypothetical protein